jgi:hypothetical protein
MMIGGVLSPALPDLRSALRRAGPARPLVSVEERGTAGAAARDRRAAPRPARAPARLGRPGRHGRADRVLPGKPRAPRLVSPGTVVRWRRRLVTRTGADPQRTGRPPVSRQIGALTGRLAIENHGWGHPRNRIICRPVNLDCARMVAGSPGRPAAACANRAAASDHGCPSPVRGSARHAAPAG